jgi:hypothetical protein
MGQGTIEGTMVQRATEGAMDQGPIEGATDEEAIEGTMNVTNTFIATISGWYILYILYTVHIVQVPCFPVSDVEVSSSTSIRALVHTYK